MKEIGQVGRFIIALIVVVPMAIIIAEIYRPGYISGAVFGFVSGVLPWIVLAAVFIVAVIAIKNKMEGSSLEA